MSFAISADLIGTANGKLEAALADDYDALGRQLERRGIAIEAMTHTRHGFRRGGSHLGRGHRRHALRPLPRPGRAAQHP